MFQFSWLSAFSVQSLAQWQIDGVNASKATNIPILLGEFNTASCGGIPGISDTFAATLWAMDYALQLASIGYQGVFIHTREAGITYNLFDPDGSEAWTTMPTYYSLLPVAEALSASSPNGSYIMDLDLHDDYGSGFVAGYGIYDSNTHTPTSLLVFNYADAGNQSSSFKVPVTSLSDSGGQSILLRTLAAPTLTEKHNISWGGKTFMGVSDAKMVGADPNFAGDQQVFCGLDSGCQFEVPSPGAAVLFIQRTSISSALIRMPLPVYRANSLLILLIVFFHVFLNSLITSL
jgi:hypothetical protein